MFQYISCYSLSRLPWSYVRQTAKFQYISCYSLSTGNMLNMLNVGLFQYISCYSLSVCLNGNKVILCGFNTSHVTLYQCCRDCMDLIRNVSIHLMLLFILLFLQTFLKFPCFNTSHVTLYQKFSY